MREAPSIVLINRLIAAGAKVRAYDPVAMNVAQGMFSADLQSSGKLVFAGHQYEAVENADAIVLVTEWKPFRMPDFAAMHKMMKQPVIFDGRNVYEPSVVKTEGFEYQGIGR
jgi:UDPglucose 6-dehydrogenase